MAALDIAILVVIALCVVIGVGEPLLRQAPPALPRTADEQATERLMLQKDMVYGAIRDLDFDFQTDKVDQDDYTALRQQLERDAVHILRQLDTVDPFVELEQLIEQQVRVLRQPLVASVSAAGDHVCAHCRTPYAPDALYCPSCGPTLRPL